MSRGMVIEYFPVGSLMLFILPQVFLGGAAVPERVVTGDPHGQRSAIGEKPVAAWIRGRVRAVTKVPTMSASLACGSGPIAAKCSSCARSDHLRAAGATDLPPGTIPAMECRAHSRLGRHAQD